MRRDNAVITRTRAWPRWPPHVDRRKGADVGEADGLVSLAVAQAMIDAVRLRTTLGARSCRRRQPAPLSSIWDSARAARTNRYGDQWFASTGNANRVISDASLGCRRARLPCDRRALSGPGNPRRLATVDAQWTAECTLRGHERALGAVSRLVPQQRCRSRCESRRAIGTRVPSARAARKPSSVAMSNSRYPRRRLGWAIMVRYGTGRNLTRHIRPRTGGIS